MSAFEFFFSFYGLMLGLSVAALASGFTRILQQRRDISLGVLTPLLAVFLAIDIVSFWNQAWVIFKGAPYSYALLIVGLVVAVTFYVAASLVFPRDLKEWPSLDEYFWRHKRMVLLCVLTANLIVFGLFVLVTAATGEIARFASNWFLWAGTGFFMVMTLAAALTKSRRAVIVILAVLLTYMIFQVGRSAATLIAAGGWSVLGAG